MKLIKKATNELAPLLLHLIDQIIQTKTYPKALKVTKVMRKPKKEEKDQNGWRPINIVSSVLRIVEQILLEQITDHLNKNNLILPQHHGGIKERSTQSIILKIHDHLMEIVIEDKEALIIPIDQSHAYKVINHELFLKKMKALRFQSDTLELLTSYL